MREMGSLGQQVAGSSDASIVVVDDDAWTGCYGSTYVAVRHDKQALSDTLRLL